MKTKVNGEHIKGYPVFSLARRKGLIKDDWETFYIKFIECSVGLDKPSLCYIEDDYIFIEEDDCKFLNKHKSKGYTLDKGSYRVRIAFRGKTYNRYTVSEEKAIEIYNEMRNDFTNQIAEELRERYALGIIQKLLNKYGGR